MLPTELHTHHSASAACFTIRATVRQLLVGFSVCYNRYVYLRSFILRDHHSLLNQHHEHNVYKSTTNTSSHLPFFNNKKFNCSPQISHKQPTAFLHLQLNDGAQSTTVYRHKQNVLMS